MMVEINVVEIIIFSVIGVMIGAFITGLYLHESQFNRELNDITKVHNIIWKSMLLEKEYRKLEKENEELKSVIIKHNIEYGE